MRITGKTRIMFILGDPVAHIVGTDVFNTAFAERGLDVACSALHVSPASLPVAVDALRHMQNVAGTGITIPHKIAVVQLVDELTPEAILVGAVNFVRRNPDGSLTGHNIDGTGFIAGLTENGVTVSGKRVLQVGAGGVGRAIAFAVAASGAAELVIANRKLDKAVELAGAVGRAVPACEASGVSLDDMPRAEDFGLVINCTSLGIAEGDPLPFDPSRLNAETVVAEVVMTPAVTPVMAVAQSRGCKVVPGRAMIQPQPALVAGFFGLS